MMNQQSLPQHVAIIMDGNGRWAKARRQDRVFGHVKGARVAKKVVEYAAKIKLPALTLYAFSEENWGRPIEEVNFLMRLLKRYIIRERQSLIENNICFRCIGQLDKLPDYVRVEVEKSIAATAHNTGLQLTFALSYGGRQEITQACIQIAHDLLQNSIQLEDINEQLIGSYLQTAHLPDPDLLIRTSGEWRLSNFLPWQSVYTELYFTDTLWPDFTLQDFDLAIRDFLGRERRFGRIKKYPMDLSPQQSILQQ
jgi:undecaprenyl diphosphate synthase